MQIALEFVFKINNTICHRNDKGLTETVQYLFISIPKQVQAYNDTFQE